MHNTSITRYRKIFLAFILFFCSGIFVFSIAHALFWPRLALATCQPGHEGPPEGGSAPSTSGGETVEEKPKIPKEGLLEAIFGEGRETTPVRPLTTRPSTPETTETPLVTVPESECCEFTSLSIRNIWEHHQDIEVIVAGQSKIIHPNSTHTFSGNLGECVRITVKSTDPSAPHLLIEDVPVCCKDLKKGRYPRFFSINIVNFTARPVKPCPGREVPPPVEKPPKPPPKPPKKPPKPPPVEEPPSPPEEPPEPPKPPPPEGPVTTPPAEEPLVVTTPQPVEMPLRLGIDITKCAYAWLPEKDNTVTFTAKIYKWVPGRGWVFPGPPRIITFQLSGISREKGICLNKDDQTTPDLYFSSPQAGFILSGGERGTFCDTARTRTAVVQATVTVTSDDYGSFGWIKSSAPNCEDIAPNGPVSIPLDDNLNTIADSAPQDAGGAPPGEDKDGTPVLDAYDGDGYTNYEEYRGFFVQRAHLRTDITMKDLMINDRTAGIGHYPSSNIVCHRIRNNEISADRECNFNRGHATTGAQHGLIMRMAAAGELPAGVGGRSIQIDGNSMGPPRNVSAVVLASWTARRAAHELGHSTCVWHHGEASWEPTWIYAPEDNAFYNNRVSSAIRRGWRAAWGDPPLTLCGRTLPAQFMFHPKGKQQSGDVNCVLKYVGLFNLYSENGMFGCWPADADGTTFCSSPAGTGFNAGGLVGGNADRGNCRGQLRVNDK